MEKKITTQNHLNKIIVIILKHLYQSSNQMSVETVQSINVMLSAKNISGISAGHLLKSGKNCIQI